MKSIKDIALLTWSPLRSLCTYIMNKTRLSENKTRLFSCATDALSLRYPYTILILFALIGINNPAWTTEWKWQITVGVSEGEGTVYAGIEYYLAGWRNESNSNDATYGNPQSVTVTTNHLLKTSNSNRRGKVYVKSVNFGYSFLAWYDGNGNQLSTSQTYEAFSSCNDGAIRVCYAKFSPVTVSSAGSASAISFNKPETKTVTLYFPVSNNADENADFNAPTITANTGWTITSWNLNTSTHKVEVVCSFTANADVAKNTYTATVTLKAKSNKSNTGTVTANVDLTPTLTYNNGSVDISVSDADKTTIDVSKLLTKYQGPDGVAGDGTITYSLKNTSSVVSITSAGVFYAKATGTYTIVASAAKKRYYAKTAEFTVTVTKRTPTVNWVTPEHIYAADVVENIASLSYANKSVSGVGITLTSANTSVLKVEGQNIRAAQNLTAQTDVVITAVTEETEHYQSVTATHTYKIEPKATPVFLLNGTDLPASPVQALRLLIGETATMAFENTDESNGWFKYPMTPEKVSYTHNSTAKTGVITATLAGDEVIQFAQTGTATIFEHTRQIHVYVSKHPVTLSSWLDGITCEVGDEVSESDAYAISATPTGTQPTQNAVTITSSNENIVAFEDGMWRAMNEGTATLTFAMPTNDYWTGDTITATITVNKKTPEFTWMLPATSNFNREYTQPVISTNTDEGCTFTYTTGNASAIRYENGALNTYEVTANNVAVTVTQNGNYKWKDHSETFYVSIQKLPNHLPLTINSSSIYDAVRGGTQGEVAFQNGNVIRLGGSSTAILPGKPCYDWNDKWIDIAFEGIPAQLSFDIAVNDKSATGEYWYVKQKANKDDAWSGEIWHSEKEGENYQHFGPINLDKDTRYVRLCYSGNFAGLYKDITITELKKIDAPATTAFGSSYIGNEPTEKTVSADWYNVKTCTVALSGANADCFELVDNSIASTLDAYGTAGIRVRYKHDTIGTHTATLTITSADAPAQTATVTLTGETKKAIQSIIWREDITPLPLDEPYAGAAVATSGLDVTLTAETPSIVTIEGAQVTGVGVGTTRLFAYQAGDTKWEAVRDTITIEVTNKHVQHIIWTDKLSNVKREDGKTKTVTLTAYSDADASLPITYQLDANAAAFASVSDNILTITGWGTGYITARQAGNDDYVAVSKTLKLVSRDPNADCEPLLVDEPSSKTLHTIDSETFSFNDEPRTIAFDAKCDAIAVWGLWIYEDYGSGWKQVQYISRGDMSNSYAHYGPYNLNINTRRVKISADGGSTMTRTFKNLEVTLAKYLRLKANNMDFSNVEYGQVVEQEFTIDYSNLSGTLDVSLKNASEQFQIMTETVGEDCGEINHNAIVRVRFTGHTLGTETNTIVLQNNKNQKLEVPVSATVVKASQVITWNDANPTDILTTDNIVLTATATSSIPVTFVSGDNTIAEPYDKGDGTYGLTIHTSGSITITARQAGNDRYSAAPEVAHTYTISKATPVITSLPVAATMTLPNTSLSDCALTGGAASTAGSFAWEDGSQNATLSNQGYTVLFIPDNTAWYNTVRLTVVVPVQKAAQTITWTFSDLDMYCNAVHTFAATASSGLPVRYETSDASIAYVDDGNHLRINKGGEVTITARQDGDDIYTAAPSVPKTLTIRRMAPAIVTVPTVSPMKIGRLLSDASLSDGRAELNSQLVEGVFAWVDGNSTTMNEAGTFEKQIAFNPSNSNYYEPVYTTLTVVVEKYAPDITHNLRGSDITYGQPLSESVISGTITATDNVKIPSENVEGSYTWVNPAQIVNAGMNTTATVRFTPDNTDWYNAVELDVPLNIAQAEPVLNITASHIRFGQPLSRAVLSNIGGTIGSCSWPTELDADHNFLELGTHNLPVTFTSADPNYLNATGSVSVEVLEGYTFVGSNGTDGDNWNSSDNWQNGDTPGDDDKVFVNADVVVTNHVSVGSLTIIEGANITIQDGGVLEIGDDDSFERAAYGDITVHNGGELILGNGELDVRNLIIEAAIGNESDGTNPAHPGRSGQVTNPDKLAINGDVYFELVLDQSGSCTPGWYDFTVPFPVDAAHGVSRWQNGAWNNNLQIETHYAIMAHYEDIQAQGNYGWKKYHGILQPGEYYTMTINNPAPRYRFRKVTGAALGTPDDYRIAATGTGDQSGWNGIGNGTLTHANLQIDNVSIVQIYDHATNSYTSQPIDGYTYVVGSAVFVQVAQPTSVVYNTPDPEATLRDLRAPQRQRLSDTPDYAAVSLTAVNGSATGDHLYLAAAQDADNTYSIGHDLLKMGTPASAKIPQIWSTAYGKQLCAVELPEQAGGTTFDISLYAPAEGYYLLQAEQLPDHTELWLTEYGVPVWNLSLAPYTLTLPKGTTTGFALTLMPRTVIQPVTTGTDRLSDEPDPTRKILLNDHVYILRNGMMFDAAGKRIR